MPLRELLVETARCGGRGSELFLIQPAMIAEMGEIEDGERGQLSLQLLPWHRYAGSAPAAPSQRRPCGWSRSGRSDRPHAAK